MKYLSIILVILLSLLGGYWYGYAVGFTESRILSIGGAALDEISAIEELKFNPEVDSKDLHESKINKALIHYGEYIEKEEFIALPVFYSAKPVIYSQLDQLVAYRKNNPRIVNGQVYAPFTQGFENKDTFKNLVPESKEKYLQEKKYYKRAME